jgi:hypothetical protein
VVLCKVKVKATRIHIRKPAGGLYELDEASKLIDDIQKFVSWANIGSRSPERPSISIKLQVSGKGEAGASYVYDWEQGKFVSQ